MSLSAFTEDNSHDGFQQLASLADDLLFCMIQPLMFFGGKTPKIGTPMTELQESQLSADQETEGRLYGLQELVNRRDEFRCVLTGKYTFDLEEALFRNPAVRYEGVDDMEFTSIRCTHIVPHMLNEPCRLSTLVCENGNLQTKEKRKFWSMLNCYCPGLPESLKAERIDTPENAMMLCLEGRHSFQDMKLWLTRVDGGDDISEAVYEAETATCHKPKWLKDTRIVLKSHEGIPLPSKYYLSLHRALCMALDVSGAGRKLDVLLDEDGYYLPRELAEDGRDAEFLEARLRLFTACI
ncbi:hypothetical protein ABW21_db0205847 [Orbilia brochopaga]|nr:hypothetical protein ABW21_db0205847 [Drechslerella brochopaga]